MIGVQEKIQGKKIAYVVTIPFTIESFFIPQLKFLSEKGFDVTVICSYSETLQKKLGNSVQYIACDMPRGLSLFGSLKAIKNLIEIFRKNQFDLVQYSTPNAALYSSIAAKIVGIKIRNYHLMGLRYLGSTGINRKLLKSIEKISCALSTSIECVSDSNLKMGISEGLFPVNKATVVWNGSTGGVDLNKFNYSQRERWRKEIRDELGLSDKDFIFGFVGRITRDKGINEIFEAFQQVSGNVKLLMIGQAEGLDTLDQDLLNVAKQDTNVIFHDSVFDIERYYASLDVLLLPSYREGFGNVVIEAAAVGTPAIISDIPGPIDAIEKGRTAKVIPVKDVKALLEAMQQCISQNQFKSKTCAEFAALHFDSEKLCEYIFKRKRDMLFVNGR